ncbi:MAG: helix-turn-helix domain-containing protein [Promethearchaeota archaeon]
MEKDLKMEPGVEVEEKFGKIRYSGGIEKKLAKKEFLKSIISSFFIALITLGFVFMIIASIESENATEVSINVKMLVLLISLLILIIPPIITYFYYIKFVKNFKYAISEKYIRIFSGVFTKKRISIPFSRIQNIAIVQGVFDRMFNLYTAKIETAGASGAGSASGGTIKPEGYIPGLKDTSKLEGIINILIHKYTQIPSNLKGRIFENPDIAFDQFAAYFLEKILGGGSLKNNLKKIREQKGLTQAQLAEKVGVTRQTIYYLEAGKYMPSLKLALLLADALDVSINDLFALEEEDKPKQNK